MGHDLSKIVDTLYQTTKNERLTVLENLLQDKDLCKSLVKGAKDTQIHFLPRTVRSKKKIPPSKTLLPPCTLDAESLVRWSANPSEFWQSPEISLDPNSAEISNFYDGTVRNLFFYDLLQLLNPQGCNKTVSTSYDKLSTLITSQSSIHHDLSTVRTNIVGWVRAGRRYHRLSTSFGVGILMALPARISVDFLEKRLPLDDTEYEGVVKQFLYLKEPAQKSQQAAERIRSTTLNHFRFLQVSFSSPREGQSRPFESTSLGPLTQNGRKSELEDNGLVPIHSGSTMNSHDSMSLQASSTAQVPGQPFEAIRQHSRHTIPSTFEPKDSGGFPADISRRRHNRYGSTLYSCKFSISRKPSCTFVYASAPATTHREQSNWQVLPLAMSASYSNEDMMTSGEFYSQSSQAVLQEATTYPQREVGEVQSQLVSMPTANNGQYTYDKVWDFAPSIPTTIQYPNDYIQIWLPCATVSLQDMWSISPPIDFIPANQVYH
ncbi:hypothetical protein SBOR_6179 [Sclerotinia borealis F-4128]|uniref:Uncharacterized protein n=1 Tax=Sclerotinia borealis (strain F-4128) TaxID=1432307 RepID=W9C9L0_SCLBF|nr:hypothetical protein SBOR_6179 [Sclerotinia borealis F-4128]